MDRAQRLRLISKVCYYLAWVCLLIVVVVQVGRLHGPLLELTHVSGRNLLEACAMLFLACVASEARALGIK